MLDVNGILGALQGQPARNIAMVGGGAAAAGLAAGMLTGKPGRKLLGKAAKYGAVAALGGLAYHAISRRQESKAPAPAPASPPPPDYDAAKPGTAFLPAPGQTDAQNTLDRLVVRAMITAAKADGAISEIERLRIHERMFELGLDAESRNFVAEQLSGPMDLDGLIAAVQTPEEAAEVYAASLVAIDVHGRAEQAYLSMLSARLGLDPELVDRLHDCAAADRLAPA